jgi:hypothetical protein
LGAIRLNESNAERFGIGDLVSLKVIPRDCHILRREA